MSKINYNQAISSSFKLEIPGLESVNYFVQNVELPSISCPSITTSYRNKQLVLADNKVVYDPLSLNFVVSEDYSNYISLMEFFFRNEGTPDSERYSSVMTNISLHAISSNRTTNKHIEFVGAVLTGLSSLSYEHTATSTNPITCTATFDYQFFRFITPP